MASTTSIPASLTLSSLTRKTPSYVLLSLSSPYLYSPSHLPRQTGSAHCMLAPYYFSLASSRLPMPSSALETLTVRAKQGGPRRQGELTVRWDRENWRCKLRGRAVTVMEGKLLV